MVKVDGVDADHLAAVARGVGAAGRSGQLEGEGLAAGRRPLGDELVCGELGDTNGSGDVFLRDLTAGTTVRASITNTGAQVNGDSLRPSLSDNGSVVAFESVATNLSGADTNATTDVLVRNGAAAMAPALA